MAAAMFQELGYRRLATAKAVEVEGGTYPSPNDGRTRRSISEIVAPILAAGPPALQAQVPRITVAAAAAYVRQHHTSKMRNYWRPF